MGSEPMWVCIANGVQVCVDISLARVLTALENTSDTVFVQARA